MAQFSLLEVFNRPVVQSYIDVDPLVPSPFVQSGAFVADPRLSALLSGGSPTFVVPYIGGIDAGLEPNYGNTIYTDIAMPRDIKGGSMEGRVAYLNEAFREASLQRYLTQVNALELIGGKLNQLWLNSAENRARATLAGLRNYDQANGKKLTTDISAATATAATGFSFDAFVDVEATMRPANRGNGVMVVHPQVAAKIRKNNQAELLQTQANIPPVTVYNGRALVESELGTKIGTGANAKYVSLLAGAGAFSYAQAAGNDDLEVDRTAATSNGAGDRALWTRRNMVIHPQGFSFIAAESTLTGGTERQALSASWGDLQKAENWELTLDPLDTGFRFLISNL
ncbi:hypothetical protein [Rosenbergiella australiborealis]|uniref:hypothetical protein n=1 Tax=Rosenbergiella australiborealis TaxID=1544696 RepID=UPI001F4D62BA|nr:hypothetical protein [Rosenbergiella australiborealis]